MFVCMYMYNGKCFVHNIPIKILLLPNLIFLLSHYYIIFLDTEHIHLISLKKDHEVGQLLHHYFTI